VAERNALLLEPNTRAEPIVAQVGVKRTFGRRQSGECLAMRYERSASINSDVTCGNSRRSLSSIAKPCVSMSPRY
jgi:hypothetical protein